jgi:hypothetical protein
MRAGLQLLVMRRGAAGVQLYDSLRVDCAACALGGFQPGEPVSFFSGAAFSADGKRIAATGSCGGTYIAEVRPARDKLCTVPIPLGTCASNWTCTAG